MIRFFKPAALLLALVAGMLDTSAAQDEANVIIQIGSDAVTTAATTSSLANSVGEILARFSPIGGSMLETIQRIKTKADENAQRNNELNADLQSLLNAAQSFTETEDNLSSIFNGRKLRTENDK
ncbi:hypothetical protein PHPALM_29934 [Phytophthora palmivora]|uniref:RxLR effector n=1 Tax=Phytophthora palmivora TaxID=4796 RepID=A0A2P4X6D8_9STRA|nr:hypothetical protein PHPALM_29934 [Phytophthora palmivora]